MKRNRRLGTINYGWLLLIGFGFLAVSLAGTVIDLNVRHLQWRIFGNQNIYQNSLPTAIGRIIGIIFPLLFGMLSDRAAGRRGRRLPFILAGLSAGAILLFLIPLGASQYFLLLGVLAAFSLAMTAWQTPAVALMMDGTPSYLRSKANGILGLMGGVGTIAAYLAIYRFNPPNAPDDIYMLGIRLAFGFCAVMVAAAWVFFRFFVWEPKRPDAGVAEAIRAREASGFKAGGKGLRRSRNLVMISIFLAFIGCNAMTFFMTLDTSGGTMMSTLSVLVGIAGILPAGLLGSRFGRKRMIAIGLAAAPVIITLQYFIPAMPVQRVLAGLWGLAWPLVSVNALPMAAEFGGTSRVGRYVGLYFSLTSLAFVVSSVLFGLMKDYLGLQAAFLFTVGMLLAALACMLFVEHGEAEAPGANIPEQAMPVEDGDPIPDDEAMTGEVHADAPVNE